MEHIYMCFIIGFAFNLYLDDAYKITTYHEVSMQPLEKSRNLFTKFKRDLSESSLKDPNSLVHESSVKNSYGKQEKGLLGSLLGGLGSGGGSQSGGGKGEENGSEGGGGFLGGTGGSSGGGGELLSGLGGVTSLLSLPLSILGLSRSQRSNEQMEKDRMIHVSSRCGNDCSDKTSAIESSMLDSDDSIGSEVRRFRKDEGTHEIFNQEPNENKRNLLDVDADGLNNYDNSLQLKESAQFLDCGDLLSDGQYSVKASDDPANYVNFDTNMPFSKLNLKQKSRIHSNSETDTNQEVKLRHKRQLGNGRFLVDENVSVPDSGRNSEDNNNGVNKNSPTGNEQRRLAIFTRNEEHESINRKGHNRPMGNTEGLKFKEERSNKLRNKESSNKNTLEIKERSTGSLMIVKMGNEDSLDIINRVNLARREMESIESSRSEEEVSEIARMKENRKADRLKTNKSSDNINTKDTRNSNLPNKEIENIEWLNPDGLSSLIMKNKELNSKNRLDSINIANIGRKIESIESLKLNLESSKSMANKDLSSMDRLDIERKSTEMLANENIDNTDKTESAAISSKNLENVETFNKERIPAGNMRNRNKNVGIKKIPKIDGIITSNKNSGHVAHKEMDNKEGTDYDDMTSESANNKAIIYLKKNVGTNGKDSNNIQESKFNNNKIYKIGSIEIQSKNYQSLGDKDINDQDQNDSRNGNGKNIENKEVDNNDSLESHSEKVMDNKDNKVRIDSEDVSNENVNNKEINYMVSKGPCAKISTNAESNGIKDKERKQPQDMNSRNVKNKEINHMISTETNNNENAVTKETVNKKEIDSSDIGKENEDKKIDISRVNVENEEWDSTGNTEIEDMNNEHVGKKKIPTFSSENTASIELCERNCKHFRKTEIENTASTETDDLNSENKLNKVIYSTNIQETDNIKSEIIPNNIFSYKDILESENISSETVENEEMSNTGLLERNDITGWNSEGWEIVKSDGSLIRDQSSGNSESKEFNRSDRIKGSDVRENVMAWETGLPSELNSDDLSDDKAYQLSDIKILDKNHEDKKEITGGDSKENKAPNYSLISDEDFINGKESSLIEEFPDYSDYSYVEYVFDSKNPESRDYEDKKPDDSSIGENNSKESVKDTEEQNYYSSSPYSLKYNLDNKYTTDLNRKYRAPMYRFHPQSSSSRGTLSNVSFKRNVPPVHVKQLEMPLNSQYPSSIAESSLYGSYASAQSRPFFGLPPFLDGGLEGGEELGEEEVGEFNG